MFDRSLLPSPATYYGQFFKFKTRKKAHVLCCFHPEKTGSLEINLTKGSFYCYGCGAKGGDVVNFHMLKTGLSFVEAAKDLGAWVDTRQDTPEQLAERKRKIEQADREHKIRQEQAAREEQKAAHALIPLVAAIRGQCTSSAIQTPYFASKGLQMHNVLTISADQLHHFKNPDGKAMNYGLQGQLTVAVLETLDGLFVALQAFDGLPDDKGKYQRRYIGHASVLAGYYRLGDFTSPAVIVITEGIADAVSCFEAAGYPVIAAGSVARLEQAAQAVKVKYPGALIVIFGDNDSHGKGQEAARSAAAAVAGVCVIPDGEGVKDANDLLRSNGQEAVKIMIDAAIEKKKAAPSREEDAAPNTPPQDEEESIAGGENEDAAIDRLSRLSAIEYERVRTAEASRLNIRATVLDKLVAAKRKESQSQDESTSGSSAIFEDVNAWPYSVQGDDLLTDITAIVQRFTVLSVEQARACALWIAFTWFIDGAKVAPMINITSPEKRCGKSTLLLVIESMVSKPLLASNITGSALFRSIELWTPTLLIDETDAFLNEKEELRGILNAGHYRKTAFVIRTVGDNHEPRKFMTWCAKVLCGIGKIAHTLTDRSIVIELRRKLVHEQVENIHLADESEFAVIRQKLKRWTEDNLEQYRATRPPRIEGINDRAADNWQPLQAIAELAGKEWPGKCRHAAIHLAGIEEEAPSVNVELLMDIAEMFHEKSVTKLFTADLLDALCRDEEKPWATWNRGKPISAHQVSKRLSEFGIKPNQIRIGAMSKKGYELPQINEAIIRYKPTPVNTPHQTETPKHPNDTNAFSDSNKRNNSKMFRDEKPLEPLRPNGCFGVSDSDTQKQGHKESEGVNGAGWSIDL